jgi:hypothetical protein
MPIHRSVLMSFIQKASENGILYLKWGQFFYGFIRAFYLSL